ncbi:MAG TPA: GldG family protein, partial [Vicinamibacteria bacterium]|nr:GldG family protein [Vicinamibacteria bacterium]
MRKLVHALPVLGVLLVAGSLVPALASRLPGRPQAWLAGGLFLVLLYVVLRWDDVAVAIGRRQLRYGSNTAVLAAAVLAILVMVNWIASRYTLRLDLTKERKYSLSDQTRKVVQALAQDVKVTHFFVTDADPGASQRARDRLTEYEALSPRITVRHVDVRREPAQARAEEIKAVPTLLIEYGGRREKINAVAEQDITNALIKLTRDAKKTACFVKGDGERDLDGSDERGLSRLRTALERAQYGAQTVSLLREPKALEPCTVTVVAGPEQDLTPEAVAQLRQQVAGGGKALVMVEPEFKAKLPNLAGLLAEWGLEAGSDVVLDIVPRLTEMGLVFTADERIIVEQYPWHEITKAFPFRTVFSGARSLKAADSSGAGGPRAQNLVETSPDAWAKSDLSLKPPLRFDEKADKKGPIAIGAVSTIPPVTPSPSPSPSPTPSPGAEEPKKPEGRVAAFGDVDFASNAL